MHFFEKPPYRITRRKHAIFVRVLKDYPSWSAEEWERYRRDLQSAVRRTVSEGTWRLLHNENPAANPEYEQHVRRIAELLAEEYGLAEDAIKIGVYHAGLLVLGFPGKKGVTYPYYYHGVQLKPRLMDKSSPCPPCLDKETLTDL